MKNEKNRDRTTRGLIEKIRKRCLDGFCLNRPQSWICDVCPLVKQSIKKWGIDVVSIIEDNGKNNSRTDGHKKTNR